MKHLQFLAGLVLFLIPFMAQAQTMTATASANGVQQGPTATPSAPAPPSIVSTPEPTPTPNPAEVLTEQIKSDEEDIRQLTDDRADTDLEFRHLQRDYVEDLMRAEAAAAKKAGNRKKAAKIMKEIKDWETLRAKEWDQDRELMDKRAHLRQLQRDQARLVNEKLQEKLKEGGYSQRLGGLVEGLQLLDQMQDLDQQQVALEKQLNSARENYDYKGANEIRAKLKDLRGQFEDLMKKAADKLRQFQPDIPKESDQQNL